MDRQQLLEVLDQVRAGAMSPEDAARRLSDLPYAEVAHAVGTTLIDHHRELRTGVPEIVFGAGKTPEQIAAAMRELARRAGGAIATRIDSARADALRRLIPEVAIHDLARIAILGAPSLRPAAAPIAVVCAGTSDLPVAEEAAVTAEAMGNRVERVFDCGVAGLHRLVPHLDRLNEANAIIAVAGMEGALPSVLGGLVDRPVIAVPTSVGYGASFGGVAALLAMLNSCAPGVSVVNIDNGYGAAAQANQINKLASKLR
ncbi:MAG: nickel pincer cofactor biosynthesis protein LarB [bacterium]